MKDTFGAKLKKLKWPIAGVTAAVIVASAGIVWLGSIAEANADSAPFKDFCDTRPGDTASDDTIAKPHGAKVETTDSGYSIFNVVQFDGSVDTYVSFGATFTNNSDVLAHHTDVTFGLKDDTGDPIVPSENYNGHWSLEQTIPDIAPGDTVGIGGLAQVPNDIEAKNDLTMTTHVANTQWLPDAGSIDGNGLLLSRNLRFMVASIGDIPNTETATANLELYSCEPAPAPGISFVFRDTDGAIVGGTPAHMVASHNPEYAHKVAWKMDTTSQGGFRIPEADLEQSELSVYPEHLDCETKTLTSKLTAEAAKPAHTGLWYCLSVEQLTGLIDDV